MNPPKPTLEQKTLASGLDRLSVRLGNAYRPPNDTDHKFERSGWLLVRAGLMMIEAGDRAHALASDWAARGFPSGTGGAPGGGASWTIEDDLGRIVDSVPVTRVEAASQQLDEWEAMTAQLAFLRRVLDDNAGDIESRIARTIRVLPNEGRRDSLTPCGNPNGKCENKVTGFGEDRLKDGRCPRCYKFRQRTGLEWNPRLDITNVIDAVTG